MAKKRRRGEDDSVFTFFSGSGSEEQRYLSNFAESPVAIPEDFPYPRMRGKTFPGVENAFQACKYAISDLKVPKDLLRVPPRAAKRLGGLGEFKKQKITLDVERWKEESTGCMKMLVELRFEQDEKFREIVESQRRQNKRFVHLETRCRGPPEWGARRDRASGDYVGANKLGKIYDEIKLERYAP